MLKKNQIKGFLAYGFVVSILYVLLVLVLFLVAGTSLMSAHENPDYKSTLFEQCATFLISIFAQPFIYYFKNFSIPHEPGYEIEVALLTCFFWSFTFTSIIYFFKNRKNQPQPPKNTTYK